MSRAGEATNDLAVKVSCVIDTVTNTATWSVSPDPEDVPWGDNDTIIWTLIATDQNGASIDARLAPYVAAPNNNRSGIYFKSTSGWNGSPPLQVADTNLQYSVPDNNNGTIATGSHPYGINVQYLGVNYNDDPSIDDEGEKSP